MSSLDGINGTIFMYGQTGAGKTFTMMGTEYRHLKSGGGNDSMLINEGSFASD